MNTFVQAGMASESKQYMHAYLVRHRKVPAEHSRFYEARSRALTLHAVYLVGLRLQFEEDTPECPPVNRFSITPPPTGGHVLVSQYLRSHIGWGTQEFDCVVHSLSQRHATGFYVGEPKVDDSDILARIDKDVL